VDIFDAVESVIGKDAALAGNVKIFLYFIITAAVLKLDFYILPPGVKADLQYERYSQKSQWVTR
jgi:hypothetical protein